MTIWFTGDHHFNHANIIKYANRPFSDVNHMDAEMINRWNCVVDSSDTVYHLGDFCLGGSQVASEYFSQLNGQIKVLANHWHHDKRWLPRSFGMSEYQGANGDHVEILPPMVVLEFKEFSTDNYPRAIILCHYQLKRWDRRHYGSWHLFGHSHGTVEGEGLSMDCGVDTNDFYPFALSAIARTMKEKERGLGGAYW